MTWQPPSVLLVGGPDAGKSNYLSRAWLAMERGRSAVTAERLPADAAYIQQGAEHLLQGNFVPRTEGVEYQPTRIPVQLRDGDGPESGAELVVPDCSGERWWDVYDKRRWRRTWENHVSDPVGVLVFYRAQSKFNVPALDWISCARLLGCSPTEAPSRLTQPKPDDEATPTDPAVGGQAVGARETPTQVVLVDLIQLLVRAASRNGNRRVRLAMAVSAWDRVPKEMEDAGPMAYIEREMPLLAQFLDDPPGVEAACAFGVSVAGGDLRHDPEFRKEFLTDPHGHGYVVADGIAGASRSSDITLPIAWLMGAKEAQ